MTKKKQTEETYVLTPLGSITTTLVDHPNPTAREIMDGLELVARRQGHNAMLLVGGSWEFVMVEMGNEKDK